jgi:hypothetical protein
MTKIIASRFSPLAALGLAALAFSAAPARAALDTVFVSGKIGIDSTSCGAVTAPCRTFQVAHNHANANGEIIVLDAASYGPVTITKALGIVNDGAGTADVLQTAAGQNAITINAGFGSVHLRGLSLDGAAAAAAGVRLNSAGSLTIVNCVARNFTNSGFLLAPTGATSFLISNTIASDNGNVGVNVFPQGSGSARGVIDNATANNNVTFGVIAQGSVAMTVVDGVASKNAGGIGAFSGASIMVRETASSNNSSWGYGVANSGSVIRLAHSVASGNKFGVAVGSGGVAESFVDNNLRGNTTAAVSGTLTTVAQQ